MNYIKKLKGNTVLVNDDGVIATLANLLDDPPIYFYISSEDLELVSNFSWYIEKNRNNTVRTSKYYKDINKNIHTSLHRLILSQYTDISDPTLQIDHIDRNPLNNTRSNLRLVSSRVNNLNKQNTDNSKTQLYGVTEDKNYNTYESEISVNNKKIRLGAYNNIYDAGLVHDRYIYLHRPQSEYDATNLYNNKYPQEELNKRGIDKNDLSTIPFIASNKQGNNNYNGVYFNIRKNRYIAQIFDNDKNVLHTKYFKTEIEAAAYREQYLIDNPDIKNVPINKSNILWSEEDGKINIAGIILTKDEYEEKTRGY